MRVTTISLKLFVLTLVIVLAGELVTLSISYHSSLPITLVLGVERLLLCLILLMLVAVTGPGLAALGFNRDRFGHGLKRGLIWSAWGGLVALVFFGILYAARISPFAVIRTQLPAGSQELMLFFLTGAVLGPVAEEVFFRGIVYGFLRKWGVLLALVGTTAVFVAAHTLRAGIPLPQIVGGLVFAIAYEMEGSLLVPIVIHVLGNAAIFSLCLLNDLI
jgi:membrane protease YdiL (CAAX protease family)